MAERLFAYGARALSRSGIRRVSCVPKPVSCLVRRLLTVHGRYRVWGAGCGVANLVENVTIRNEHMSHV